MIFTLIVGTKGPKKECLQRFFCSIPMQVKAAKIEIILVDQNNNQEHQAFYSEWSERLNLKVFYDSGVGLSRARNIGLQSLNIGHNDNRWLLFPDDDCEYPSEFFSKLLSKIKETSADGFYFRVMSSENPEIELAYTKRLNKRKLTQNSIFSSITSINFSHRYLHGAVFDNSLGIGAEFFSSEEMDYVSNLIETGFKFEYAEDITVQHPDHSLDKFEALASKVWFNSLGHGAFAAKMFKRGVVYVPFYLLLIAPISRILLSTVKLELKLSILGVITLIRRITGFVRYLIK